MNIIEDSTDLSHLKNLLDEFIIKFNPTELKGMVRQNNGKIYQNEYNKEFINADTIIIDEIKRIIKKYLPDNDLHYHFARLNKIEVDTNLNDSFHTDAGTANVIFLHYPNSNTYFKGGEFEWLDSDDNTTIIKTNTTKNILLIDNPPHRVLNVIEGERYSFAFFFDKIKIKELL
jgi:hypothetical protein